MNLKEDKIKSYLGFAVKSREFILGIDDIIKSKMVRVILISNDLSENALDKLNNFASCRNIKIITISNDVIMSVLGGKNIKAIGITNKNLSDAIANL